MKFYKRDPDAALTGMVDLTLQERGAYNTIIDLLYSRDGVVADDDEMLRRAMGCHGNEWRAVKSRLIAKRKIWIEDGYIKANRVDSVLKEAENFSETQRIRAGNRWEKEKKSKKKTENNEQNQSSGDAKPKMPYTPIATATTKNIDIANAISPSKRRKRRARKKIAVVGFEEFWDECPRKVGKGAARKAYATATVKKKTAPATLKDAMRLYAATRAGEDEKFTVHPSTWLNAERWLDGGNALNGPSSAREASDVLKGDEERENLKRMGLI